VQLSEIYISLLSLEMNIKIKSFRKHYVNDVLHTMTC